MVEHKREQEVWQRVMASSELPARCKAEPQRALTAEQVMELLQDELIDALKALLEQQPEDNVVTFKAYTVVAGDSLSQICAANNLDYGANYRIILAINGIEDADQIYVGQTILLPVVAEAE